MDEAQLEVDKKSVKWKTIPIDQSMKAKGEKEYKEYLSQLKTKMSEIKTQTEQETGQIWSDVMQNDKCFYIGYHRAGELASIAVDEAGKYYKLRVPLTAGYTLGRNWAETH